MRWSCARGVTTVSPPSAYRPPGTRTSRRATNSCAYRKTTGSPSSALRGASSAPRRSKPPRVMASTTAVASPTWSRWGWVRRSASTLAGSTRGREARARTSAPGPGSTQSTVPARLQTSPPEWRVWVETAKRAPAVPRNLRKPPVTALVPLIGSGVARDGGRGTPIRPRSAPGRLRPRPRRVRAQEGGHPGPDQLTVREDGDVLAALHRQQLRPGDARGQRPAVLERGHPVGRAVDDQGGRGDPLP